MIPYDPTRQTFKNDRPARAEGSMTRKDWHAQVAHAKAGHRRLVAIRLGASERMLAKLVEHEQHAWERLPEWLKAELSRPE